MWLDCCYKMMSQLRFYAPLIDVYKMVRLASMELIFLVFQYYKYHLKMQVLAMLKLKLNWQECIQDLCHMRLKHRMVLNTPKTIGFGLVHRNQKLFFSMIYLSIVTIQYNLMLNVLELCQLQTKYSYRQTKHDLPYSPVFVLTGYNYQYCCEIL